MSDAEKLKNIHDVVADYIYTDISAVDCMDKIIEIFGDADWFLEKEDVTPDQKDVLADICKYRQWRFKEDSHAQLECYCSREPRHYGEEPLCKFQCMEVRNG